jgi:hypothetical protein
MMWVPVALGLVGVAVGVAGFVSCRDAKTLLPLASLPIIANGVQGTYLHVRGIAQRPGGCAGPPLARGAPVRVGDAVATHQCSRRSTTASSPSPPTIDVGGGPAAAAPSPRYRRFPGFDVLDRVDTWDSIIGGTCWPGSAHGRCDSSP